MMYSTTTKFNFNVIVSNIQYELIKQKILQEFLGELPWYLKT